MFLSSDGQSIHLGHNWVYRIEEALGDGGINVSFRVPEFRAFKLGIL